MVMMPHVAVSKGSHILGVTFFRTRLLGNSLFCCVNGLEGKIVNGLGRSSQVPGDIRRVKDCQPLVILQVANVEIRLEAVDLGVSDVGPVEKAAEEQEGEHGQYA
jgi:hypothetical protein